MMIPVSVINIFTKIKDNITLVLVGVCAILLFFSLQMCDRNKQLKAEKERSEQLSKQNTLAILDSIHIVKDKLGNTEADKASYVATLKDLKNLNSTLYNKIKAVEGNVISIINSKVHGEIPPMVSDNELIRYADSLTYGLKFKCQYKDSGLTSIVGGVSKFKAIDGRLFKDSTIINENKIALDITYGFKESDKVYTVFAKSASKYITFNQLDGALIITKNNIQCPPVKKKKWSIGPYIGYAYGARTGKFDLGLGIGLQYNMLTY